MRSFQKKWISLLLLVIFTWQYVLVSSFAPTTLRQFFQASLDAAAILLSPGEASAALLDETADRLPAVLDDTFGFGIGDVDSDGDPDAVVANAGQSRLLINEGGTFADETADRLPALTGITRTAVVADFDGDGAVDLFLPNAAGQNRLLINDGTGRFSDETAARLPTLNQVSMGVKYGDLDRDGDLDLVVANRGSQNRILLNNGGGIFTDETTARIATDSDSSYDVALADIDGNKTLDLLVVNQAAQNRLFLNNGLGVFTDVTASRLPVAAGNSSHAAFADVDGDGDPDLLVAEGEQGLRLLVNDSQGAFTDESAGDLPALTDFIIKVAAGDMDYDGDIDLVLANAGQDRLLLNGSFVDATGTQLPADSRRSFAVAVFDADGDFDPDLLFGTPGGQNRVLFNDIAFPRLRVAVTPDYIETGDSVTIAVEAFDEDGIASIDLTVSQQDATQVSLPLVNGTAAFTPTVAGDYTTIAMAEDNAGIKGERRIPFTVQTPDVTPPQLSLTYDAPEPLVVDQKVAMRVTATDDRVVAETALTVNGAPVPLDAAGNGSYVTTVTGLHTATARAVDPAGNESAAEITFAVEEDTEPPFVSIDVAPDPVDLRSPVAINVTATDNVAVSALSLRVVGPGIPNGRDLPLDPDGQASLTPYLPGLYDLEAVALDPSGNQGLGNAAFEAQGVPDTTPPIVTLKVELRTVAIGGSVTLTVDAIDDEGVESISLEIDGSPVTLDAFGSFDFIPPQVGEYTAVASAQDFTGNQSSITETFRAVDPASDTSPPIVSFSLPEADAELTAPTQIIGTVNDETLVSYTLEYSLLGENQFTNFATGDVEVIDDVLGKLDTTLLENGMYRVRLTAEDLNGQTAEAERVYLIKGNLKVGNFTITYSDLTIPLAGIPISVTRTYDSRVKSKRDFGVGWTLDISRGSYENNRKPGDGWFISPSEDFFRLPCSISNPTKEHITEIRFSDSERQAYQFALQVEMFVFGSAIAGGCLGEASFVQIGGAPGATLEVIGSTDVFWPNGSDELLDFNTFQVYEPQNVRLKTLDGRLFDLNLTQGLTRIEDRNGNSLTITEGGLIHSSGRSVNFTRDGANRITRIIDPMGNTLEYDYDANGDLVAFTDQVGNVTNFIYNSRHELLDIIDPLGRPVARNEYDADGRLISTTDAKGNSIAVTHNIGARQEVIRDRLGNFTIYEYDLDGNVVSQTDALGNTASFSYDDQGNQVSSTDPLGNTTTSTHNSDGRILTRTDPLGNTTLFTYNARSQYLTVTDKNGNVTEHTYDTNDNLLSTTDPLGNVTSYTYDAQGQPLTVTDPLGNVTSYAYDSFGNLMRETDPLGNVKTFTYDANGNRLTETVTRTLPDVTTQSLTTAFGYDKLNRHIQTVDPDGNMEKTEYDPLGNEIAKIDKLGNRTEFVYDAFGNLLARIFPDGTTEQFTYDAENRRVSTTDRAGNTTNFEYDALARLIRTIHPDGAILRSTYDAAGKVITTTDERGNTAHASYDAAGRKTEIIDALGNITTFAYDANDNIVATTDANGHTTSFDYDGNNKRVRTIFPDGTSSASVYDLLGREVAKTDQAGNTTRFEYDALSRLTKVTDALGNETIYTYDEVGNKLTQTDANGNTTRFEYDKLGRMTARTLPIGMRETMSCDANNNLLSKTDFNGDTTTFTYDSNNRVVSKDFPDGTSTAFTYTPTGKRESESDPRGLTTFEYDSRDRLLLRVDPDGSTITYTYDGAGNSTSVTTSSAATTHTYDAVNRLSTVTGPDGGVTTYTYDRVGNRASVSYPNGTVANYTYDALNRLISLETRKSTGEIVSTYTYTLGLAGNRLSVVEDTGRRVDFAYDALYRLVQEKITDATLGNKATSYAYDPVGNRQSKTDSDGLTTYIYDANNRVVIEGDNTITYDNNGNTLMKTDGIVTTTYAYNFENRLISAETGSSDIEYSYDADGIRVRSTVNGVVTDYLVDKNGDFAQVLEERDIGGALIVIYTHGADLISQNRGGAVSYYHYDGQMSTRILTDADEAVIDRYVYGAFGILLHRVGTTENNYLYTGEQLDPNIGYYYLRARYLVPELGRFLTTDPFPGLIFDPPSLHKYLYAGNDPVNKWDPSGEQFTLIGISIAAVVAGILVTAIAYYGFNQPIERALYWGVAAAVTVFATGYAIGAFGGGNAAFANTIPLNIGTASTLPAATAATAGSVRAVTDGLRSTVEVMQRVGTAIHLGKRQMAIDYLQKVVRENPLNGQVIGHARDIVSNSLGRVDPSTLLNLVKLPVKDRIFLEKMLEVLRPFAKDIN